MKRQCILQILYSYNWKNEHWSLVKQPEHPLGVKMEFQPGEEYKCSLAPLIKNQDVAS